MVALPLGDTDWARFLSGEARIRVKNRYYEQNPTNQQEGFSLLSRPGLKRWRTIGTGPIRAQPFSQQGAFGDDLFVMSGDEAYRISRATNAATLISGGFFAGNPTGFGSLAATGAIGSTPEYLYIADGTTLWLYLENGFAQGTLVISGVLSDGDVIEIGGVYYRWSTAGVDSGAPAGTIGNPWRVLLGSGTVEATDNMRNALDGSGQGVTCSTALIAHPTVNGAFSNNTSLRVVAKEPGTAGNAITTTETGATTAWGGGVLAGGGLVTLTTVSLPDDLSPLSVGFIAGYVIVVPAQTTGFGGRFFWIEPGETFIRPLNFATAERSPDPVYSVRVFGDQFALYGPDTTEFWYPTGDLLTPFLRVQGQLFSRGIVEGTDVEIKGRIIVVDATGEVYVVSQGEPLRVSDSSIEERIRTQLRLQAII